MLLRRAVFIGLLAAIVLLTVLMVLLSRSPAPQHTAPQPAPQQTVPAPPQTPPVCTYSYKVEFCDEAGCTLSLTVEAEKTVEVKIDGYAWKVARGTRQVQVPWNSTLRVESPCFSLEYTPQLYYTASARVLEYDVETGQKRVEVTLEFSLPYRGDVVVGGQRLYAYGKRLRAIVTTYDGVPVKIGPFASVLPMPEPQLSLNVTAYSTCDRYVYVVRYNLTNAESARWRYYTLRRGQLEITSAEKLDKLCLGPHCALVAWEQPRVEVEILARYYIYYFPLIVMRIKNGPTCWEGVVNFTAPTKLFDDQLGARCYNTALGQVCLPSDDVFMDVLRNAGGNYRDVPFRLTLRPHESYTFAYVPLGIVLRIGNTTVAVSTQTPELSFTNVNCVVKRPAEELSLDRLTPRYVYTSVSPTEAYVAAEYVCNATLTIKSRGYVVVNPLVAVRGGDLAFYYMPRVAASYDVIVPISLSFPLELATYKDYTGLFQRLNYNCTAVERIEELPQWLRMKRVTHYCRYTGRVEIALVPFTPYVR
ncbi:MAG: hypothetical protein QXI07_10085 [Pyrobaculum sp.]